MGEKEILAKENIKSFSEIIELNKGSNKTTKICLKAIIRCIEHSGLDMKEKKFETLLSESKKKLIQFNEMFKLNK